MENGWTGWLEWKGGECPVERGEIVLVRLRNGVESKPVKAHNLRWRHLKRPAAGDIIAYRIAHP